MAHCRGAISMTQQNFTERFGYCFTQKIHNFKVIFFYDPTTYWIELTTMHRIFFSVLDGQAYSIEFFGSDFDDISSLEQIGIVVNVIHQLVSDAHVMEF